MMKEAIVLGVEHFKFSIFDSVPKPEEGKAYILYREDDKKNNVLIITAQNPALSSQVRAGGFNKKMTISTSDRKYEMEKEVSDISGNFRFTIYISFLYRIQDIAHIFTNKLWNTDDVIEKAINKKIESKHKKYEIDCQIDMENELKKEIIMILDEIFYFNYENLIVTVQIDDRAKKIINSNLDTLASTALLGNEGDRVSVEIKQKKRIELEKLEAEKEIEVKRTEVNVTKAQGLNALKTEMGDDFALFMSYAKGEISSLEYDERMQRNANAAMMSKIAALKQLVELDVLSGPQLEKAALKMIGEGSSDTEQLSAGLPIRDEESADIIIEDTEEY